jgi:hypothetical protein
MQYWEHILMYLNVYVMKCLKARSNRLDWMIAVSLNMVVMYVTIVTVNMQNFWHIPCTCFCS